MERTKINKARIVLLAVIVILCAAFCFSLGVDEVSAASKTPAKVTGVKVSSTYNSCTVSWSKAKYAAKYKVYQATKNNKTGKYGSFVLLKTTTSRSLKNTGRVTGNTYAYKVRAVNGSKYGSYSITVYATCKPQTTTLYTPSCSTSGVKLTWKNINGETGYKVYRATSYGGSYTYLGAVKGTTYTDTKGTVGKTYYYKVRAYKYNGYKDIYGNYSNVKTGYKKKPLTPIESNDPDEPTEPVKPEEPVKPSDPTDPVTPVEPTEPTDPVTPVDPTEPSDPVTPVEPGDSFNAEKDAYLEYSKTGSTTDTTKIYIGQEWSNELNAKLNGGTAVAKTLSRNSDRCNESGVEDIYCYDTEDFDNFLIVYVKGGKVIAWQTNAKVLGVYKGVELVRGTQSSEYKDYSEWLNSSGLVPYLPDAEVAAANIEVGDIYFGGIIRGTDVWDTYCNHNDLKGEEKICEYTINALRVTNGWNILNHNDYLYGDGETYGMLAWSKTQSASGEMTHGELTEGPLAGKSATQRGEDIYYASSEKIKSGVENVSGGGSGERVANSWYRSVGHSQNLMVRGTAGDTEEVSLHAVAVYPSKDGVSEYWSWTAGYNIIDWGVVAPKVSVSSVASTSATIEWTDTLSQFEGTGHKYTVEVSTDKDFGTVTKRASGYVLKYTASGLESNTTYYVRVKAFRKVTVDGSSSLKGSKWSDVVEFRTKSTEEVSE